MTMLTENILTVYRASTPEEREVGASWYPRAFDVAASLDPANPARAAGIIAALSPKNGWANNMAKAAQLYAQNGDGTGCGMSSPVGKAIRIYNGADPVEVLTTPAGKKTLNFFLTIVNPAHNLAVVDAHAHDIAVGEPCEDKVRSRALSRKGGYETFASAYREAANAEGIENVSVIQAITWVSWRSRLGKAWYG